MHSRGSEEGEREGVGPIKIFGPISVS